MIITSISVNPLSYGDDTIKHTKTTYERPAIARPPIIASTKATKMRNSRADT